MIVGDCERVSGATTLVCFGRVAECQDGETGQKSGPAVGPVPMACFES